jgi:hypothetical protein
LEQLVSVLPVDLLMWDLETRGWRRGEGGLLGVRFGIITIVRYFNILAMCDISIDTIIGMQHNWCVGWLIAFLDKDDILVDLAGNNIFEIFIFHAVKGEES